MAAIKAAHPAISDRFFTGIGHEAQFIESEVLVNVLLTLKEQSIVALPVHDAVLVPASSKDQAIKIMLSVFHDITGVEGQVKEEGG